MKKILAFIAAAVTCLQLSAQTDEEFAAQYQRQTSVAGLSGIGVDYILNKWETAFPGSANMLEARFAYFFDRSRSPQMVVKNQTRFLGAKPAMSLKDSLGRDVHYFQEYFYDDEIFGMAMKYIDNAVLLFPDDLAYRYDKITALIEYEKESPEMARDELLALIEFNNSTHPQWKDRGESVDEEYFINGVQEYCYSFFRTATPVSYDAFRMVSERMSKLYPKNTVFLSNLGSYWLVAQKNNNKALSCYGKVLKVDPKNYAAIKNCVLLARKSKNVKLEKKYLPLLIEVTSSEAERISAEARLKSL